ncbi:hypothetical protein HG535_0A05570 [Zygotorulaspora mrakii]|uniref:Geranylgeranyl pyrophosphate synthase n=1 Tax=Zygotorulaspora mrakii TaxID=42260 RepID=A0A7H9AWE3_ZYGMR|nr:uncharacterized protein HG535_0A05570 [Zygotorulaspora mrakii]QLG70616.1 hypothetical protein HG535_0A05570 [Zygotorulaspora mrakii]
MSDVPSIISTLVTSQPLWTEEDETVIQSPYRHLAATRGKNFRSKLIEVFNVIYKLPQEQIDLVSNLVGVLHNSSLLIDDIEDSSEVRRGKTTAHLIYGIPMTINTANYMYFKAMEMIQLISNGDKFVLQDLMVIFNEEMINLHRGQGLDIYWRDSLPKIIPDDTLYFNMVMNKTGGLFRLTVKIMERLTKVKSEISLIPLSNLLGIIYQVRDDYQNLLDEKMIESKGLAEDISEGKLSFPIIHGLRHGKQNNDLFLQNALKLRTNDLEIKRDVINYLQNESKSMDYTKKVLCELTTLAKNEKYIPYKSYPKEATQFAYIVDHLSVM